MTFTPAMTLFPDHFHEHAFRALTVEFGVEDLLPRAEIKLTVRDCDGDFAAEELALQVRVGVVLACAIVTVFGGVVRDGFFEKIVKILHESRFIVIDVDACRNVHRVYKNEAFFNF